MKLYTYWRSTAAYRVRMALNLKGIEHDSVSVHLVKDGGQQNHPEYLAVNPQGLVPALVLGSGDVIAQSMAIMEYLEETHPTPALLPADPVRRAQCRAMAQMVASDIHPLNNLRVLQYLKQDWTQGCVDDWYAHWIYKGFAAIEKLLAGRDTVYAHADHPCASDICLVAQVYNANRFKVSLGDYPNILAINERCLSLPEIQAAVPENQGDAT